MAMSKKDFVEIAEVFRSSKPSIETKPIHWTADELFGAYTQWRQMVRRTGNAFENAYPRFDRDAFFRACEYWE